ncbi:hypothetical protein AYI86_18770 [Shewanella algae]|nr:hypothetical protein AYI86_18770 [Shewanella algae]
MRKLLVMFNTMMKNRTQMGRKLSQLAKYLLTEYHSHLLCFNASFLKHIFKNYLSPFNYYFRVPKFILIQVRDEDRIPAAGTIL